MDAIQDGMTMEETTDILQTSGKNIGSDEIIHGYRTETGVLLVTYYLDDDGEYRVMDVSHILEEVNED